MVYPLAGRNFSGTSVIYTISPATELTVTVFSEAQFPSPQIRISPINESRKIIHIYSPNNGVSLGKSSKNKTFGDGRFIGVFSVRTWKLPV